MFQLDHVLVCCRGEADAAALVSSGLQRAGGVIHHGQGTANALFHFDNAYLELVWMHDEQELHDPAVRPLGLWERIHWRETGACPFGVCVRGPHNVASWHYQPAYLPPGVTMPFVTPPGAFTEPLIFISLIAGPRSVWPRPPLDHRGRTRTLERVVIESPRAADTSHSVTRVLTSRLLEITHAIEFRVTLDLTPHSGTLVDFQPALPLQVLL